MVVKYIMVFLLLGVLIMVSLGTLRKMKSYQDYNLAGRNTGLFALTATLVAAEFNTATLIGGASVAFLFGTVGLWYTSLIFIVVFLVYAFTVSKKYRRLNISTIPQYFDKRFKNEKGSEVIRFLSAIITLFYTWLAPASYLAGLTVIGSVLLGVNPIIFSVVLVVICLLLSVTGGLMTAIGIDVVAFILILIGIPAILFIGYNAAGGFGNLSQVFEPKLLSLAPVWDTDVNFATAMTWGLQITFLYIAAPWYGQRIFSAKSESVAYKAMLLNTFFIVALYGIVVLATMLSKVVFPNLAYPEQALPLLINEYANPFLQGFLLVTLLMVGISTMVAVWNSAVSIIVNDIVSRYWAKNKGDRYMIRISRLFLFLLAISTLALGIMFIGNIQHSLLFLSTFTGMVAIPILMSLYWKKYNSVGAISSMAVGLIYCTLGILLNFPMYYISPIGVVLAVIAGGIATLATANDSRYRSNNEEFFKIVESKETIVEDVQHVTE
ncbi:sodium:solute symporter family protein [Sporosarcina sp. resist]|uniref:sodium:solute symporter family protein n=1 Tax=Sporosarcina sp. resist TaxID=2762563 RepID=UPI00164E4AC4|nr:sodium:solute symporter family protein [Sporosarcina sp. resist]QNK87506.1 sodium:solute symporter family protein [Sporosarcina sp. resist]